MTHRNIPSAGVGRINARRAARVTWLLAVIILGVKSLCWAESSRSALLTLDQHLIRADFIGEVVVKEQNWDTTTGLQRVRFEILAAWFSRWNTGGELVISTGPRVPAFVPGRRHVVLISGGPWEDSPFTFRAESVFSVDADGTVSCRSGNPLFGVMNDGFLCTVEELVIGRPLRVEQMREQLARARARAARRLPELEARLSATPRALELEPSQLVQKVEVRR